jgi:hypothetical protein
MSIFLSITLVAMLAVFSVDVMQKRREFLKQYQSTKQ